MERYTSTLAVTAACVGLLLAAHYRIVGERETVSTEPVAQHVAAAPIPAAVTPTAWVEPPAKPITVAAAPVVTPEPIAETAAAPEPPAAAPVVTTPAQHTALRPERAKRAEQAAKARKLAQARERRMRIAARATPEMNAERGQTTAQPAQPRIDPIGDLLRGLGLGNEG